MQGHLKSFLVFLILASCGRSVTLVDKEQLFPFEGRQAGYFPKEVMAFAAQPKEGPLFQKYFPAAFFKSALHMFDEKSLLSEYQGKDIVRLTKTLALGDEYFSIRIENSDGAVSIIYKETHRLYTSHPDTLEASYSYDRLEFDSSRNEYQMVSYSRFLLGKEPPYRDSISVTGRKRVNPLIRNDSSRLDLTKWDQLIDLLNSNSYAKMSPVDTMFRMDGYDYLLEIHTKDGYYVVDRFAPDDKGFLEMVNFILSLVGKKPDE